MFETTNQIIYRNKHQLSELAADLLTTSCFYPGSAYFPLRVMPSESKPDPTVGS